MRKNKFIISALIAVALTTSSLHSAKAADGCDFKNNLKELTAAQTASQLNDNQENILKELSIRKKIISQAIDCSINETLSLQSDIKSAEANSSDLNDIKNKIISRLDEIIGYYRTRNDAVGNLGIGGSKTFSANFKLWRNSNYIPMSELGKNFIVFLKNQDILQTTQSRLNQISITLKTLGIVDNQKVSDILNQAAKNIRTANDDNDQAQAIFNGMIWPNNVSDIMVSSLQHLKDAYQNFFDIGTEAQSIISSSK